MDIYKLARYSLIHCGFHFGFKFIISLFNFDVILLCRAQLIISLGLLIRAFSQHGQKQVFCKDLLCNVDILGTCQNPRKILVNKFISLKPYFHPTPKSLQANPPPQASLLPLPSQVVQLPNFQNTQCPPFQTPQQQPK